MYQLFQYIKFLFTSSNQHGVHSPFVFDLVTKCFYDKASHDAYAQLKAYRQALISNKDKISVSDYGAGSKHMNQSQRTIKDITKISGTTLKRAKLLLRIVEYLKPTHILELGTSLGIATQAMAMGHKAAMVTSIEGCPNVSRVAKQQLEAFQVQKVNLKTGRFEEWLPTLKQTHWDLVFIDGNHQKEATLHYFEQLLPSVNNDSLFIFDDIHWTKGMTEAWKVIKQHSKVTVTIDTFFWGLVFFRKEQAKENFKIRV